MQGVIYSPRADEIGGGLAASAHPAAGEDQDALLIGRCRQGDMNAFGLLVARHEKRVFALVRRILGPSSSPDDVDDVVQDIFVQAWRALPRYRGDAHFATWLYRIATNMTIKQWHRAKRRRQMVIDEDLPEAARLALVHTAPGPSDEAERKARDRALRTAIESLPDKQRVVVLLHYFEDVSCEDVAQIVGCSVGTVWSRLHYACRKLRGMLAWLELP